MNDLRIDDLEISRPVSASIIGRTSQALHFLIHLEVANQHRMPRAVALARTLMRGGHDVTISYEPKISFRFAPTDVAVHHYDAGREVARWRKIAPELKFIAVDTFCGDSLDGMYLATNQRQSRLGALLAELRPSWVIIWGGEFEFQEGTRRALVNSDLADRTIFLEVAWLPQQDYLYFDTSGINSRSSLVGYDYPELSRTQESVLHETQKRFRFQRAASSGPPSLGSHIFVPLQIESDTSFRIGSPFPSNAEFIDFLERWVPQEYDAVLKLHPKERICGHPPSVQRQNFRLLTSGALDRMMLAAGHVIGLNSTVLVEAAMLGKHVVALGRGIFTNSGAIVEALPSDDPNEVLARPIDTNRRNRFLYELLFRRQVALAELRRYNYDYLADKLPFSTILEMPKYRDGNSQLTCGVGKILEKIRSGEAMIKVGKSRVSKTAVLDVEKGGEIVIGDHSEIRNNAVLEVTGRYNGAIRIGNNSVVGVGSWLQGSGQIDIGDDVIIGPYAAIISTTHQHENVTIPIAKQPLTTGSITIENDVWLGAHVTVALNVKIGAHSIVGANSFVNSDIPPYSVAVGSPARVIRGREPKE